MDFLCVGKSKLKVVLSADECNSYNIKSTDGEYCTGEVRLAIRRILDLAAAQTDFRVGTEKVLVQLYPLSGGGSELFITKLSSVGEKERRAISVCDSLTTYQGREAVFCFESLSRLISAVRTLGKTDTPCDVYRADSGEYYIRLTENIIDGFSEFEHFTEFGSRVSSLPIGVMGEWGRLLISGRGLSVLSKL